MVMAIGRKAMSSGAIVAAVFGLAISASGSRRHRSRGILIRATQPASRPDHGRAECRARVTCIRPAMTKGRGRRRTLPRRIRRCRRCLLRAIRPPRRAIRRIAAGRGADRFF